MFYQTCNFDLNFDSPSSSITTAFEHHHRRRTPLSSRSLPSLSLNDLSLSLRRGGGGRWGGLAGLMGVVEVVCGL
ncbi:hypothetical protein Hanom_Chr10g00877511 [Helianthus anomalus]